MARSCERHADAEQKQAEKLLLWVVFSAARGFGARRRCSASRTAQLPEPKPDHRSTHLSASTARGEGSLWRSVELPGLAKQSAATSSPGHPSTVNRSRVQLESEMHGSWHKISVWSTVGPHCSIATTTSGANSKATPALFVSSFLCCPRAGTGLKISSTVSVLLVLGRHCAHRSTWIRGRLALVGF